MDKLANQTIKFISTIIKLYDQMPFALKTQLITFRNYVETYNDQTDNCLSEYIERLKIQLNSKKTKTEPSFINNQNYNTININEKNFFNDQLANNSQLNSISSNRLQKPKIFKMIETHSMNNINNSKSSLKITLKPKSYNKNSKSVNSSISSNRDQQTVQKQLFNKLVNNVDQLLKMYHRSELPALKHASYLQHLFNQFDSDNIKQRSL